jgi:hypothetical protein
MLGKLLISAADRSEGSVQARALMKKRIPGVGEIPFL